MAKAYPLLRTKLRERDIDQYYLAELLERSQPYISDRMNAVQPWTLEEMYKLLELISEPPENMHIYFPRRGIQDLNTNLNPQEAGRVLNMIEAMIGAWRGETTQAKNAKRISLVK